MTGILRQPLLHFVLIGTAIFGLFALVDDTPPQPDKPVITVSDQDGAWLAAQFSATWRRPPTETELNALIDDFIREEIYVRAALSFGLDQGDAIVRRRLRQKMEFLSEAGAQAATPDEADLQAHFEANLDHFTPGDRVAFEQILLPDEADLPIAQIRMQLAAGADPDAIGRRTLLPRQVPLSPQPAIDGTFGSGLFDQITNLTPGEWDGPILSGYGQHLVRVTAFEPGLAPDLDSVRDRVELDWRAEMAATLRQDRFDALRDQYEVERPDVTVILSQ